MHDLQHHRRSLGSAALVILALIISAPTRAHAEGAHGTDEPGIALPTRIALPKLRTSADATPPALRLTTSPRFDRSTSVATGLALGTTLGGLCAGIALAFVQPVFGISLAVSSLVVGPSLGHFYAGEVLHGSVTLGLRAAGVGGFVVFGLAAIFVNFENSNPSAGDAVGFTVGAVICAVGTLSLAIYDLIDAGRAVRRRQARQLRGLASLRVVPSVVQGSQGETRYGVLAALRF